MTQKQKLLLGAAALAGVGVYLYLRRKKAPGAKVTFGEYNTAGCDCYRYDQMSDGTVKSTLVDKQLCIDDGLDFDCDQTNAAASWMPSWLGGDA